MNRLKYFTLQILPPLLMLWLLWGTFNPSTTLIAGPVLLYSGYRSIFLLFKKQFEPLLRPFLALTFSALILYLGLHYSNASSEHAKLLASVLQQQCTRDGYCTLPASEAWKINGQRGYETRTAGAVPFFITLDFDEPAPGNTKETPRYLSFELTWHIKDFSQHYFGGVRKELKSKTDGTGE